MEEFLILLFFVVVLSPLVLSITALIVARQARSDSRVLREELRRVGAATGRPADTPAETAGSDRPVQTAPEVPAVQPAVANPPPLRPKVGVAASAPAAPPAAANPERNIEVALGGKLASFIGIAALVLGVVFFVGYAIQHGWLGPAMRVLLGLISGVVLVGLGHVAEIRSKKLKHFARVLTGGGAALLFFTVFSAHGFYGLIGPWAAVAGLVITALVVLGLAMLYDSQVVGVLGVVGALLTPVVIGGVMDAGVFPLAYLATVNGVVLFLGIRRNWQWLYNLGFVFTILFTGSWLAINVPAETMAWAVGLGFCALYFAQFVGLSLVKLKVERKLFSLMIDQLRMLVASLLLMAALYYVLDAEAFNQWMGAAFLVMALIHVLVARLAWRWMPRFKHDILVLLGGAVAFASLALPVQLDGAWVSLGWSIQGFVLALFARRYGVRAFMMAGVALGFIGLFKALSFDFQFYDGATTPLFLNSRFLVSLGASLLLGAQAWMWRDRKAADRSKAGMGLAMGAFENVVFIIAVLGFIAAVGVDALHLLTVQAPWAWMSSSIALLLAAGFVLLVAKREANGSLQAFGLVLLLLLPLKLLLVDVLFGWWLYSLPFQPFFNGIFFTAITLLVVGFLLGHQLCGRAGSTRAAFAGQREAGFMLHIVSILSGIFVVTLEIGRAETAWSDTAITLWWAMCGLTLIFFGLRLRQHYLRYTALALFGAAILKVFLFDLAELSGLVRVAAFMGVGLVLLILSFTYHRIAPQLTGASTSEEPHAS